jgi:hypothetical protein
LKESTSFWNSFKIIINWIKVIINKK